MFIIIFIFLFSDVVIPTSSTEKANIVLKAGQKVMVLKSPKGIYMQLESGKIIAIKTAFKVGQHNKSRSEGPQDCLPTMSKKCRFPIFFIKNGKIAAEFIHCLSICASACYDLTTPQHCLPTMSRKCWFPIH